MGASIAPQQRVTRVVRAVCGALLALLAAVAEGRGPHRFNHLDFDDGLPGSFVTSIYQRADGYVWIGTDSGLVRYDGYDMLHLQYQSDDAHSLSNSWIRDLREDAQGRLWVATDRGLNRLRDDGRSFVRYFADPADPATLPGDKVMSLAVDRQGVLWAATESGLARYDAGADRFQRFVPPGADNDPLRRAVRFVVEDAHDRFWVGTHRGLLQLDRASARFSTVSSADPAVDALLQRGYFARGLEDSRGALWFAVDGDGGLLGLDAEGHWSLRRHDPADPHSLQTNSLWSLAEDRQQRLWVGTWGEGLALLDAGRTEFTRYRANEAEEFALPNDILNDILVDASGTVWVATGAAAAVVNPLSEAVHQFTTVVGDANSLPNRHVWTLRTAEDGTVWVGTDQGLARFHPADEHLDVYPARTGGAPDANDGAVWAIEPDGNGGVWLGTDAGLDHFDPRGPQLRHLHVAPGSGNGVVQAVYAIARDPTGDLWVSEQGVGLHRLGPDGTILETLGRDRGLPADATRTLVHASGRIWFGGNTGLFYFDTAARAFGKVQLGTDARLLGEEQINGIAWDAARASVWVATDDQGLFEIDPVAARVRSRLLPADGLPSARVYAVLVDARTQDLWVTTQAGLSRFASSTRSWQHFGSINEQRKLKFLENAAAVAADGSLLFGGTRGFIHFDPAAMQQSGFQPEVRISSVLVQDARGERRLEGHLVEPLRIAYDFHALELRVAALDYAAPQRNRYRYRVTGDDDAWVELGTDRRIVLRDLAPGDYRVQVQGTNRDGVWSPHEASLALVVAPPAWRHPLAYAAYALVAALFGLGLLALWRRRLQDTAQIAASERRLSGALWGSGDELWDWNVASGEIARNNLLPSLPPPGPGSRGSPESLLAIVHPEDADALRGALARITEGQSAEFEAVYRLPDANGGWVWVLDRGKVNERGDDGRPQRIVGTLRNVDAIMRTEEQLALVASALRQSRDGALILDREYRLVFANAAAERYLRRPAAALAGEPLGTAVFRLLDDDEAVEQIARFAFALRAGEALEGEFTLGLADGGQVPVSVSVNPIRNARGEVTHCVAFLVDITFRKQAEDELRRLANFDSLTGLPNRSLFLDRLAHALAQARRSHTAVALLFIDLDHFKHVNDSLGHAAGDELLRSVAARMRAVIRDADTVARLGGDEFTVIVEQPADEAAVATVAGKLIDALAREFVIVGQRVRVSPSIGIAMYPLHGTAAEELLMHSDIAMYHAKSEGRNNFQFYRPEMNARVLERIALEDRLRQALAADALALHYQPKLCTDTGRVLGLEALLRWDDPDEGPIPPARFIPVAEESGIIVELGHWVLRRACTQAAAWLAKGLDPGSVAVNLSARQFRDRDLMGDIREVLDATGLDAWRLELEITESTLVSDMDYAIRMLTGLRELGVRIALDDFGTGYSSLSYLRRFPIHTLKLDRSFLREVPGSAQDARLVESIVRLAHDLGVRVTAEGIESQAQWDFLRACRCEEVQGYLCARPLPVGEVEGLLPRRAD